MRLLLSRYPRTVPRNESGTIPLDIPPSAFTPFVASAAARNTGILVAGYTILPKAENESSHREGFVFLRARDGSEHRGRSPPNTSMPTNAKLSDVQAGPTTDPRRSLPIRSATVWLTVNYHVHGNRVFEEQMFNERIYR